MIRPSRWQPEMTATSTNAVTTSLNVLDITYLN